MIKQTLKTAVVVATSAIAIPYAVAILCNMLHGWPKRRDKYKHALHPKKVYALNYVVLQEIAKIRYIGLLIQWKYFYSTAPPERIIKDLPYGSHDNRLDVYLPVDEDQVQVPGNKPVVVFVYGGSWGSGDKNMYGLLCAQLADQLKAVVVCPNYSTYPKGYVDDMVQDIVDCLTWVQRNAVQFGGDKDRVVLTGHSAGGHLCVLSVLELTMKRLLRRPETALVGGPLPASRQSSIFSDSIRFEDRHFNGSGTESSNSADQALASVSTATGSFYVVRDSDQSNGDQSNGDQGNSDQSNGDQGNGDQGNGDSVTEDALLDPGPDADKTGVGEPDSAEQGAGDAGADVVLPDVPSVEVTHDADSDQGAESASRLSDTQKEARDLLSSVKLVIGLAGVYHIGDHYDHEASRGIEDISSMAKAMYAPEHFDRLSPSVIVTELPDKIKLPPLLLVHGDRDVTVPLSSSVSLARALMDKGHVDVSLSVLPGCGHHDICLDLMDPRRPWHGPVMGEIIRGVNKCL